MYLEKNLTICFSNLEKHCASQNTFKTVISEKQEIINIHEINSHILNFYENLFLNKTQCIADSCHTF